MSGRNNVAINQARYLFAILVCLARCRCLADRQGVFVNYSELKGCRDKDTNCESWAKAGECSKNTGFMETSCRAACNFCKPEPVIPDRYRGLHAVLTTAYGDIHIHPFFDLVPNTVALVLEFAVSSGGDADAGPAPGLANGAVNTTRPTVQACSGCTFYRNEAVPAAGDGPPYGLLQGSLGGLLKTPAHEGAGMAMRRGHVAMIGDSKEFFISLTDHPGWGEAMTVWGEVPEADLSSTVQAIIDLPYKDNTHPSYGTVMRMLTEHAPFSLRAEPQASGLHSAMHQEDSL